MAREKRSAGELADIVVDYLGIESLGVIVLADTVYGWNAFAMTVPDTESDIHVKMQRAVEELRIRYEIERC